ncbi:MAG: hypothetical protein KDC44_09690, partial [Phaeodactylibacter sp.]|nr:hypothetical protein [Phaeodactylibacter sp.]
MLLGTSIQYAATAGQGLEARVCAVAQQHYIANPTAPLRETLQRAGLQVSEQTGAAITFRPDAAEDVLTRNRGRDGAFDLVPYREVIRESRAAGYTDNRRTIIGLGFDDSIDLQGISLATLQNAQGMPGQFLGVQFTEGEEGGRLNLTTDLESRTVTIRSDHLQFDAVDYAAAESSTRTGQGLLEGLEMIIQYNRLASNDGDNYDDQGAHVEQITLKIRSLSLNAIRYLTNETTFGIGRLSISDLEVVQEALLSEVRMGYIMDARNNYQLFTTYLPGAFSHLFSTLLDKLPQLTHQFMPDEEEQQDLQFLQSDIDYLNDAFNFSLDFRQLNLEGLYYTGVGELGTVRLYGYNDGNPDNESRDVVSMGVEDDTFKYKRQSFVDELREAREDLEDAEETYYTRARRRLNPNRRRLRNALQEVIRLRNRIDDLEQILLNLAPEVGVQIDSNRVEYVPSAALLERYVTGQLERLGLQGVSYEGDIVLSEGLQLNSSLTTYGNRDTNIHLRGLQLPSIRVERVDIHAGGYHIQSAGVQLENAAISALLQLNNTTRTRPGEGYGQILNSITIQEACIGLFKTNYLTVTKNGETVHLIDTGQIILSNLNLTNLTIDLDNLSPTVDAGQLGITADAIMVQNLSAAGVDLAEGWFWLTALEMQTEAPVIDEANHRRSTTRIFTTRSATDEEVTVSGDPAQVLNAADVHHNIKVNNLRVTDTVHESLNNQNEPTGTTSRDIGIELDVAHIDIDKLDLALPGQMSLCTDQDVMVSNINLKATYHLNVLDPETGTPGSNHQLELTSLEVGQIHIGQGTLEVFDGERVHEVVTNGAVDLYGLYARNVLMNMDLQEDGSRSADLMSGQFGLGSMNIRQVVYNALNIQR